MWSFETSFGRIMSATEVKMPLDLYPGNFSSICITISPQALLFSIGYFFVWRAMSKAITEETDSGDWAYGEMNVCSVCVMRILAMYVSVLFTIWGKWWSRKFVSKEREPKIFSCLLLTLILFVCKQTKRQTSDPRSEVPNKLSPNSRSLESFRDNHWLCLNYQYGSDWLHSNR